MIKTVHKYLEESSRLFPNKIAIQYNDLHNQETITYQSLDKFTNKYSQYIRSLGTFKQEAVAIFMPKKISAIKAMFSILKSGNVYVPLDINSPKSRLNSIVESAKIRIIIVNNDSLHLSAQLFSELKNVKIINIDEEISLSDIDTLTPRQAISVDLAYILFTSGSTGVPKGVMIPHKAINDYIEWCVETYQLSSSDEIANHAPLYFDNSTFDIYTAMKVGATLHLVPDSINQMVPSLIPWLEESKISVFFCVPSVLSMLKQTRRVRPSILLNLKQLLCAGEVLPPQVLRTWMQCLPHVRFVNMYGPTEITVDCTYHIFDEIPDEQTKHLPIGKARDNMELFVLTDEGELTQASGERGELVVRGESVSYGYLANDLQTKSSFIQNPEHNLYPDKLYRTGDVVEIDKEHVFYFIGRKDSQVKYLGHRIELGEIEATITSLKEISEAVVIFIPKVDSLEDTLGCLVKLKEEFDFELICNRIRESLPKYMNPNKVILFSDEFPRTPNGKYDRAKISIFFDN
ncbi:amino acid adenylation domain-containing protein [Vibrio lentus]|uniref:Amidophosphoribosyltransferase n=1 Tax=Vibrio lentus TaxID=136468 RepID=A0AB36XM14_9VIBR|nr:MULTISPECIES: amino acid adenylation domain-containing protein [Vibrio]MCC4838740.1 amino acid adenylation domain-containing protein [Vibrio lentus]PMI15559.1 amidophosphoribosyltransferase [Vibrio lentus]PMJ90856.1 amidophosphoribosyltransferase [Vibrio lentus]PMK31528.1 amidophosphoribosyltransferase [Vibrio lentus]PMK46420.1 amidophosphoribosyltransferase [Vibrio lentus]